jgi:hypothetical protein
VSDESGEAFAHRVADADADEKFQRGLKRSSGNGSVTERRLRRRKGEVALVGISPRELKTLCEKGQATPSANLRSPRAEEESIFDFPS